MMRTANKSAAVRPLEMFTVTSAHETSATHEVETVKPVSKKDIDVSHSRMLVKYIGVYKKLAEYDSD